VRSPTELVENCYPSTVHQSVLDGFGSRLLKRVLTVQTGGDVKVDYDPDGLRVTVAVPLENSK
jgi:two-component sensor histidine kinase